MDKDRQPGIKFDGIILVKEDFWRDCNVPEDVEVKVNFEAGHIKMTDGYSVKLCSSAKYKKTLLKYGATIGTNATVVAGITIGRWAMIASGAVITKNVPDYALMAGVPAKQTGWVCECGVPLQNGLQCTSCSRAYKLKNKMLMEHYSIG